MAQYQRIEYRIGHDGQIIETVIDAAGPSCTLATQGIESALGTVVDRDLLPEYYAETEGLDQIVENETVLSQHQSR